MDKCSSISEETHKNKFLLKISLCINKLYALRGNIKLNIIRMKLI